MKRLIFALIMLTLLAQVTWAEGETASCGIESGSDTDYTITPCNVTNNEVFNMVVIGDSIAWGNGLNKKNKYHYLVADWLQEKLNRPVEVTVYAHSGATITGESGKSIDPNLNSGSPTLMDQARNIKNKDDVDLILVSGGINDVGIQNIMDANTPVETINSLSESIKDPMTNLLTYLLDETDAKIIVTGYYPIITEESIVEIQDRAVAGLLALTSKKTISQSESVLISATADPTAAKVEAAWYLIEGIANNIDNIFEEDANLRANSDTFYAISSDSLRKAVDAADKGQNRIKFVDPLFERKNSYRASNSFLWELNSDLKTNDFQYQERAELVEKEYALDLNPLDLDLIKQAENKINPIAHPNRKGAKRYADMIISVIDGSGLSWLDNSHPTVQSLQVTPQSLTFGESFTIDYTVLNNDGSGLTQVELWRKNETSDWQEVVPKRNTLSGETGPISCSFTDSPPAPGTYWYGMHVVDNAGNWNDEKNSNTNYQPVSFEPVEVEVTSFDEPIQEAGKEEVRVLNGHTFWVACVAFSPNGRTLASGSYDKTIKLWDVASGTEIQTLYGHSKTVRSIAFSPDGHTIASGSWDETVKLWDVANGTEIMTFDESWYLGADILSVAFSPDGRKLAAGFGMNTIKLWDVASGTEIWTLGTEDRPQQARICSVYSVAFSPDGRTLASTNVFHEVSLWDIASGAEIRTIGSHDFCYQSVAFSPDGRILASGSSEGTIKLFDVETGTEIRTLGGKTFGGVWSIAFSPDGQTIASTHGNTIKLWDVASGTEIQTLGKDLSYVMCVAFSPDGSTLASGGYDYRIRLWQVG